MDRNVNGAVEWEGLEKDAAFGALLSGGFKLLGGKLLNGIGKLTGKTSFKAAAGKVQNGGLSYVADKFNNAMTSKAGQTAGNAVMAHSIYTTGKDMVSSDKNQDQQGGQY